MSAARVFERVYRELKQHLMSHEVSSGERLEPNLLADKLSVSTTPIRDALQRLAGEKLVDAHGHEGFSIPLASEPGLRHLYIWHGDIVGLILRAGLSASSAIPSDQQVLDDPASATRALFLGRLAARSPNREYQVALTNARDRLHSYTYLESLCIPDIAEEIHRLSANLTQGDIRSARNLFSAYHRRRIALVPRLIELHYEYRSVAGRRK